jgi:hypothetical protein
MNPLQINFNCWRFFLVPRRFSRVTCGRFDLAFEWLYCHELVSLNLKVVIELVCFLKREEIEPKRLVVFTDGLPFGSWGDENYADTVWILHGTTTIEPPWGQYAYYDEAE